MAGRLRQWAGRLTGFSTPLGGASWTVPPAERDLATELLTRLEDRRVLYYPSDAESPEHCVRSVIEIRHLLSEVLAKLGGQGALADHVRALGAASRRFLDRLVVMGVMITTPLHLGATGAHGIFRMPSGRCEEYLGCISR